MTAENTKVVNPKSFDIALRATWEIEALTNLMTSKSGQDDIDTYETLIAVKGLAVRIRQLNSILMSVIDDPSSDPEDLKCNLGY